MPSDETREYLRQVGDLGGSDPFPYDILDDEDCQHPRTRDYNGIERCRECGSVIVEGEER